MLGNATFDVGDEQLADEVVPALFARTENNVLVVFPSHHDVVRAHAVAHVIAAQCRRIGESGRGAAFRIRHYIDFGVSIVLPSEGKVFAVGRETSEHLITVNVVGDLVCDTTVDVDAVEIATMGEDYGVAVDGGETEHLCFFLGHRQEAHAQQKN